MTAEKVHRTALPTDPVLAVPACAVPVQARRQAPALVGRLARQLEGIDAWNAARRVREALLTAGPVTRNERMDRTRRLEALQRTQQVIQARAAAELARGHSPLLDAQVTAVIAHRHAWFSGGLAARLEAHGVLVLACTDNGADALGAVIAEQPDIVLSGDRLAMVSGQVLLDETGLFSPRTRRALQSDDVAPSVELRPSPHAVFTRRRPADVADDLAAQVRSDAADSRWA